ncbi:MAG TPA: SRPBCC domain-containing protein, partial [Bryobacteraceae bacterium]
MKPDRVSASVEVAVDPQTAFRIFTEEIDAWWQRGPHNFYDGGRAAATRIEPGVGGRYLEVYDDATGDVLEIGRITVWEPGKRLVWRMMLDDTEVDIRFEAVPGGTLVNLEQRLIPEGTKAHFYSGWNNILGWF